LHFDLADQYRHRPSLIHNLDPRVKVVTTFLYILAVSLVPEGEWWTFLSFLILILAVAKLTRLGLTFAVRRSFVALPFVLAALAVPFTIPGSTVFKLPGLGWAISEPGLIRFASILARSWLAVQSAILLTVTTRFPDLLFGLGALRIPHLIISTVGFMYRYLFVLADEALRMMRARTARSVRIPGRPKPPILWQGRTTGMMVGSLFLRALERSERVYAAMLSRGYDGRMRTVVRFHMTNLDWVVLAVAGLLIITPLSISLGR
jgi:cobalt/nickel transport system permease protein